MSKTEANFGPFVRNDLGWDFYNLFKTILLAPLFVLRILLAIITFIPYTALIYLSCLGVKDFTKPLPWWRSLLITWNGWFHARIMFFLLGFYNIKTKGDRTVSHPNKRIINFQKLCS